MTTSNENAYNKAFSPHVGILQILNGAHVAGAVSCLAQLGIPDLLENGPKSAEELACQIGAQPEALYRLMRATACVGVLAEGSDGKFSQTPMSAVLCSEAQPSLRGLAIMGGREWHGRGWSYLEYCVKTGKQAVDKIYGMPMKPVAKRLGLGRVNWQVLRRSYATWLLADGVDVKSVQGQLRHSSSKPTLDIYAQFVITAQRRAADDLMTDLERRRIALSTEKRVPNEVQLERELERNGSVDLCAVS
jgi:hypothetical protein